MSVLKVKVIQRIKKGNRIVKYRIQDATGKTIEVEPERFKQVLRSGQAECINMTLTSDNRLIENSKYTHTISTQPKEQPRTQPQAQTQVQSPSTTTVTSNVKHVSEVNADLKDEAFITTSQLRSVFGLLGEDDTLTFEHGGSMSTSINNIINKATMVNRVIAKPNEDCYLIDFGNNKKAVVARAKKLTAING